MCIRDRYVLAPRKPRPAHPAALLALNPNLATEWGSEPAEIQRIRDNVRAGFDARIRMRVGPRVAPRRSPAWRRAPPVTCSR
eukprot:2198321-Alexandrium_andersonii.AAC.1